MRAQPADELVHGLHRHQRRATDVDELELPGTDQLVGLRPSDAKHLGRGPHGQQHGAARRCTRSLVGGCAEEVVVHCHARSVHHDPQRIGQRHAETRALRLLGGR